MFHGKKSFVIFLLLYFMYLFFSASKNKPRKNMWSSWHDMANNVLGDSSLSYIILLFFNYRNMDNM